MSNFSLEVVCFCEEKVIAEHFSNCRSETPEGHGHQWGPAHQAEGHLAIRTQGYWNYFQPVEQTDQGMMGDDTLTLLKNDKLRIFILHCKDKIPKFLNKYSQKRNIWWVIYIFPRSVCLFCWRKYVDRPWDYINRSQKCGNRGYQCSYCSKNSKMYCICYWNSQLSKLCFLQHYTVKKVRDNPIPSQDVTNQTFLGQE